MASFPNVTAANKYARAVVSGRIDANNFVRLACKRHIEDLGKEKNKAFKYKFDRAQGERVCEFIQLLPHTKGKWARERKKIKLEPWQKFILVSIFAWREKKTGLRRFREAYIEIPRKNGKSILAAGVALYCFVAEGEFGAEVYSGATNEKQAWEVFRPARLMAVRTPALQEYYGIEVNASTLAVPEDGSRFEPLIGDPGDGSSPSCAIIDEYHEHQKPGLYNTMTTGMGARDQPLTFIITTAGDNIAGPCYDKRGDVDKVLHGIFKDDQLFGIIYGIDDDDDWKDLKALKKANPNYGVSVNGDFLKRQLRLAINNTTLQAVFKTKHLDLWIAAGKAFYNLEHWNRCADKTLKIEDFKGECCIASIDLAEKVDFTAVSKLFYRFEKDGRLHYYVFGSYYLPEDTAQASAKMRDKYLGWEEAGFMTLVDGSEIDFDLIEEEVLALPDDHQVVEIPYDPWNAAQLGQNLEKQGAPRVPMNQANNKHLSAAMREIEAAIASGRLHHDGNEVLAWMISNVVVTNPLNKFIYPSKSKKENKIDGATALIAAVARAMAQDSLQSVYNTEDLLVL